MQELIIWLLWRLIKERVIKSKKYTIDNGILLWSNAFTLIRNIVIASKHCDK